MYTYIHTCIRTYTHTYIHTYMHVYIHTHTHTQIYTYMHTHTYIHAYTHTYMHTYITTYMHAYMHTYTHAHMHTYIHTYIHTFIHTYISYVIKLKAKRTLCTSYRRIGEFCCFYTHSEPRHPMVIFLHAKLGTHICNSLVIFFFKWEAKTKCIVDPIMCCHLVKIYVCIFLLIYLLSKQRKVYQVF